MKIGNFHVDVRRCLHPKNLTEFSLEMSVTSRLLMLLAEGQFPFLLHLESYLVYEKVHRAGHCHQLCFLLVHFCCHNLKASLKTI